jgi:hypothetical protein
VTITCAKTGYNANVEFLTKPFYGGKKHRIVTEVFQPNDKKPFLSISGEWNGRMEAKWADGVSIFQILYQIMCIQGSFLFNGCCISSGKVGSVSLCQARF